MLYHNISLGIHLMMAPSHCHTDGSLQCKSAAPPPDLERQQRAKERKAQKEQEEKAKLRSNNRKILSIIGIVFFYLPYLGVEMMLPTKKMKISAK